MLHSLSFHFLQKRKTVIISKRINLSYFYFGTRPIWPTFWLVGVRSSALLDLCRALRDDPDKTLEFPVPMPFSGKECTDKYNTWFLIRLWINFELQSSILHYGPLKEVLDRNVDVYTWSACGTGIWIRPFSSFFTLLEKTKSSANHSTKVKESYQQFNLYLIW